MDVRLAATVWAVTASTLGVSQGAHGYTGPGSILSWPAPKAAAANPEVRFELDLQNYSDRASSLPPAQAAKEWLALARRGLAIADSQTDPVTPDPFQPLIDALPPPAVWPLIERDLTARGKPKGRNLAMVLMMQILQGKNREALATFGALRNESGPQRGIDLVRLDLAVRDRNLTELEALYTAKSKNPSQPGFLWQTLPDLVPLMGKERATRIITFRLLNSGDELWFYPNLVRPSTCFVLRQTPSVMGLDLTATRLYLSKSPTKETVAKINESSAPSTDHTPGSTLVSGSLIADGGNLIYSVSKLLVWRLRAHLRGLITATR